MAFHCPHYTMIIDHEISDLHCEDLEGEVIEPFNGFNELELEDTSKNKEISSPTIAIMRCILSTPLESDTWKRTSILHTFIQCKRKKCKFVINEGSTMNILAK